MKKFVGFLTALIAVILSIAFVVVAIAAVCSASISAVIKPENIIALVQSIDYSALISGFEAETEPETEAETEAETTASPDTELEIEDDAAFGGVEAELVDALMKSEAAKQLLEEYVAGVGSVFTGEEAPEGLTEDKLKDIVNENMDEIVGIVKEYTDEEISEEDIRAQIDQALEENAEDIVASLPTVEDVKNEFEDDTLKILRKVFVPKTTYTLIALSVVLALLIYACRYKRFGGFMWIGVDCIIAGCFAALIKGAFSIAETVVLETLGAESIEIVAKVLAIVSQAFTVGITVLFAVAAISIALCIILRKAAKKKAENAAVQQPVLENAERAEQTAELN